MVPVKVEVSSPGLPKLGSDLLLFYHDKTECRTLEDTNWLKMSPLMLLPFKYSTGSHLHFILTLLLPPTSTLFLCSLNSFQRLQLFPHSLFNPIQREFGPHPSTKSVLTTVKTDLQWSKWPWPHLSQGYQYTQVFLLLHWITLFHLLVWFLLFLPSLNSPKDTDSPDYPI